MPKAWLTRGPSAVGLSLTLIAGLAASTQAAVCGEGLQPAQVARALGGEWEGQMQVRSPEGKLSTAPASMSARLDNASHELELYYEGFAFGQPVEGAMILSFDKDDPAARLRDGAADINAMCRPAKDARQEEDSLEFTCESESDGPLRVVFSKLEARSWSISYQAMDNAGEWSDLVVLQFDRLAAGQLSAAAEGFEYTSLFAQMDTDSAVASVETDD